MYFKAPMEQLNDTFQKPSIANKLICISETCLHPSPVFLIVQIRFAML